MAQNHVHVYLFFPPAFSSHNIEPFLFAKLSGTMVQNVLIAKNASAAFINSAQ